MQSARHIVPRAPRRPSPRGAGPARLSAVRGLAATLAGLTLCLAPAPRADTVTPDSARGSRGTFNFFPALFYTPETGFGAGGGLVYTVRDLSAPPEERPDSYSALLLYTEKEQINALVSPEVYFSHGAWRLAGTLSYTKFPRTVYGIGRDTPEEAEEDYTPEGASLSGEVLRRVRAPLMAGVALELSKTAVVKRERGRLVDARLRSGREGGWLNGLGPVLSWDSRDNIYAPRRGGWYQWRSVFFAPALGSDHAMDAHTLDLRRYVGLGADRVLALQNVWTKVGGEVPLQGYPTLGGVMRGIVEGRYQDRLLGAVQVELRSPLIGRFRGVVFAAGGTVSDRWEGFELAEVKAAGGVGIRYVVNSEERIHLRIDMGFAKGGGQVYFQFGEAF